MTSDLSIIPFPFLLRVFYMPPSHFPSFQLHDLPLGTFLLLFHYPPSFVLSCLIRPCNSKWIFVSSSIGEPVKQSSRLGLWQVIYSWWALKWCCHGEIQFFNAKPYLTVPAFWLITDHRCSFIHAPFALPLLSIARPALRYIPPSLSLSSIFCSFLFDPSM